MFKNCTKLTFNFFSNGRRGIINDFYIDLILWQHHILSHDKCTCVPSFIWKASPLIWVRIIRSTHRLAKDGVDSGALWISVPNEISRGTKRFNIHVDETSANTIIYRFVIYKVRRIATSRTAINRQTQTVCSWSRIVSTRSFCIADEEKVEKEDPNKMEEESHGLCWFVKTNGFWTFFNVFF